MIREFRSDDGDVFKRLKLDGGKKWYSWYDCEHRLKLAGWQVAHWFERALSTRTDWTDAESRKDDLDHLRWRLDEITTIIERAQQELDKLEGVSRKAERIAKLRNVTGRYPEEAAAFLAHADRLERAE
jgi:hypothetical protein